MSFLIRSNYIFILLLVLSLISCENDLEVIKNITATSNFPKQSAEDVEVIYSDSSIITLKITAPKLDFYQKTEDKPFYEFNEGIRVYFYDRNQTIKSKISANYALYDLSQYLWEARGNVIAINQNGVILKTEKLFWSENEKRIYTNEFAKVIDDKSQIIGQGFEADEAFTQWEFKKVTGIINIEDE